MRHPKNRSHKIIQIVWLQTYNPSMERWLTQTSVLHFALRPPQLGIHLKLVQLICQLLYAASEQYELHTNMTCITPRFSKICDFYSQKKHKLLWNSAIHFISISYKTIKVMCSVWGRLSRIHNRKTIRTSKVLNFGYFPFNLNLSIHSHLSIWLAINTGCTS
jgi:hypothetical protein